jgi:hypothetical protein
MVSRQHTIKTYGRETGGGDHQKHDRAMKYIFSVSILLASFFVQQIAAQEVVYQEDFNSCSLPADWEVQLTGHPDARWWVGWPLNNNDDGTTIDSTCMLIFDDDLTGNNTPPWTLELRTPSIDATAFPELQLEIDVHFRDYQNTASLEVYVFDGTTYQLLRRYKGGASQTGTQFSQYRTLRADLSFYNNPSLHLMFRYDDGAAFAWWAGIDNIRITGSGSGVNLLLETFNSCGLPAGWTTEFSGEHDWQFGYAATTDSPTNSLNGSCMAYFDDDIIGSDAPYSGVRLISPEIDGTAGAQMILDFDVTLRRYTAAEHLAIGVIDVETGQRRTVAQYFSDLGGPSFGNFVHESVDLSNFRSRRMRIYFYYDDGNAWGWWVGLDNVRLNASQETNELCEKAVELTIDADCQQGDLSGALFDGPLPACAESRPAGSNWFFIQPASSGWLSVNDNASFNDLINVYTGDCDNLAALACLARDEHGFGGEKGFVYVEAGTTYLLRVSGENSRFGRSSGSYCLGATIVAEPPPPNAHERCTQAIPLSVDGDCQQADNWLSTSLLPYPSRNTLARADVWYSFTTTDNQAIEIITDANFADVITLYTGDCAQLQEVAMSELGDRLLLSQPQSQTTYFVRVSGAFATVEGQLCARVRRYAQQPPVNDQCAQALPVTVNGPCTTANNFSADFDGPAISCLAGLSGSIWFSFVAPPSGSVRLLPDTDFPYVLSVYTGSCGPGPSPSSGLQEIYCSGNQPVCEGYLSLNSLSPGQTYLLRLSTAVAPSGIDQRGNVCFSVQDAQTAPAWEPLSLEVTVNCFSDGQATLSASAEGGAGLYTFYGYDPAQLYPPGSSYRIVVSDAQGCEREASAVIECSLNPDCSLNPALVSQSPACHDSADGAASLTGLSGNPETYSYQWSTGSEEAAVTGLSPGIYQVTVTDEQGCSVVLPFSLSAPTIINIGEVQTLPDTDAQSTGAIAVTVGGGTPPYVFSWYREGQLQTRTDEAVATGLPAGNYVLVVTDANGCERSSGTIVVEMLTATQEISVARGLSVSPNPSQGMLQLSWSLPAGDKADLFLVAADGRRWRLATALPAVAANYPVDLTDWPAGGYWIVVGDRAHNLRAAVIIYKP